MLFSLNYQILVIFAVLFASNIQFIGNSKNSNKPQIGSVQQRNNLELSPKRNKSKKFKSKNSLDSRQFLANENYRSENEI